jgi:hypothetical protein
LDLSNDWAASLNESMTSPTAPTVAVEAPSIVEISSNDTRPWEALRDPSSTPDLPRFIVAAERRWVQFWRTLEHIPDFPTARPKSESPRFVAYVGLEADNSSAFDVPESFLGQLRGHGLEGGVSINSGLGTLQSNIAGGADAVLIFTHGHPEHGLLECRSDTFGLQPSDLKAAFLAGRDRGHPLRFLYVMACQQRAAFLGLLADLAQENALHPDFAGILMWGEPGSDMESVFREAFFVALLKDQVPFLLAVHAGRRALASSPDHRGVAWQPIAVACHPQPSPLPTADELGFESYWAALRDLTIRSLT